MARPLPKASLSGSDAKVLSGYLRNSASIAAVRLEWAVNMMPKLDMLSPEVLYCIGHMPVQRIQICALVVGASVYEKRCVYTLDDGSGVTLDCICWRDRAPADHSGWEEDSLFQVGQTLSITGKLEEYRNQRQLNVQTMRSSSD